MRPWHRKLWGIKFKGGIDKDPPILLGSLWHENPGKEYPGAPTRALLFTTRSAARQWCKERMAKWNAREDANQLNWKVTPVRVTDTVRAVQRRLNGE